MFSACRAGGWVGMSTGASVTERGKEIQRHSERMGERESETQVCRPTRDV